MSNIPDINEEATYFWMPSPGVPLASRILSYIFAALMIITIIREFTIVKPIEIRMPLIENDWKYYTSKFDISIPYPKDWIFQQGDTNEGVDSESAIIQYPANLPIHFQIEQQTISLDITTEQYNSVVEDLTAKISSEPDYKQIGTVDIGNNITLYNFSFILEKQGLLQGSYCVLTYQGKMCVLIAISPAKAWDEMQQLMIAIIKKSRG